jgi:hypothetical protein
MGYRYYINVMDELRCDFCGPRAMGYGPRAKMILSAALGYSNLGSAAELSLWLAVLRLTPDRASGVSDQPIHACPPDL